MMDFLYDYPHYALIVSNAILLFCAAVAILKLERAIKEDHSFWDSPTGMAVREDSNSETALAELLEHQLAKINNRIDELTRRNASASNIASCELPFDYAVRMAKHGASAEDLTRTCGLNKAEAQLMWRLHARQRDTKAPVSH